MSKARILVRIHEHHDTGAFTHAASIYANNVKASLLIRVSTHEPQSVWVRPLPANWGKNLVRSKDAPWEEPSDITIQLSGVSDKRFVTTLRAFMHMACDWLHGRDSAFPKYDEAAKQPCDVYYEKRGQYYAGKAYLISWPEKALARVFFVTYKDYNWSNADWTQSVQIELTNDAFTKERESNFQYRWKTNTRLLYVQESRAMDAIADAQVTPPPPPPGRPREAGEARPPAFYALPSPTAASSNARPTASEPLAKRQARGGE